MEERGQFSRALMGFQQYVHGHDTRGFQGHEYAEREIKYLGYWLREWIERGDGIAQTGGNYENYLRVCLNIADAAMQGQIDFAYLGKTSDTPEEEQYERSIVAIHDPDSEYGADYADRMVYEAIAYREQHPQQRT